jgi:hypothetical protein
VLHLVGLLFQLTTQLGDLLAGVDLLLQFGLQTQTGVEGTLQQSNPVFQAAGRYDGTIVAAQHYAAAARIPLRSLTVPPLAHSKQPTRPAQHQLACTQISFGSNLSV